MESFEIKYDNTLDEISKGYSSFWKKYALRRTVIFTVVYAIALGIGIDFVIHDYTSMPGYILIVIGLGMIFSTWTKPCYAKKIKHDKTKIDLRTERLDSVETEDLFLLFVNRSLIYIFPKRCLSEEQKKKLKNYFDDKNI